MIDVRTYRLTNGGKLVQHTANDCIIDNYVVDDGDIVTRRLSVLPDGLYSISISYSRYDRDLVEEIGLDDIDAVDGLYYMDVDNGVISVTEVDPIVLYDTDNNWQEIHPVSVDVWGDDTLAIGVTDNYAIVSIISM